MRKVEEIISDYESKENESSDTKVEGNKEDGSNRDSDSNSFTNIEFEDI